ncbi:MAG: ATP:cob(I)alamin adenosyltransferase [Halobacteriovoraceae bacterium]|nr:ATP:cob(I)alamin adenosyltransferase [Halobacteriovoraceae bacterium]
MSKSSVYTKTGDQDETSLVSGTRKKKSDVRIDLYGEVDELNSHLGVLRTLIPNEKTLIHNPESTLVHLQHKLFDLGSMLACESDKWESYKLPVITIHSVQLLEDEIDKMDEILPKLKNFILPGGSRAGAYSHVLRTVSRRCERKLVEFHELGHKIPENSLELLNRMSDYFFILSRYLNFAESESETIWEKGH